MKSLTNRRDYVEDRLSRLEDKVEEPEHLDKDK
jgi:hypothetical protein